MGEVVILLYVVLGIVFGTLWLGMLSFFFVEPWLRKRGREPEKVRDPSLESRPPGPDVEYVEEHRVYEVRR